jgi:hypothetical protein
VADHRHKREAEARRIKLHARNVIGPLAVLATASAVTIGVVSADPAASDLTRLSAPTSGSASVSASVDRAPDLLTRSEDRVKASLSRELPPAFMSKAAVTAAVRGASKRQWTTDDLNLWNQPGDKAKLLGELAQAKSVLVTGRQMWGRTEIVVQGKARWVTDGYLSDDKPLAAAAGLSMEPCPDGSVEDGLTDGAVYVYRSVCHAFPQITSYGGWDAHGEHSSGKALDIMTSDVGLGTAIAEFLQSHASELHLYDVIWRQHIWTPVRASEGWRLMPNRGSATANHFDHVHVSVY